jgi:hypothetical protein
MVSSVSAQFSRYDATNLVINTILAGDIGKVDVYSSYNSLSGNVELITNETIDCPYSGNWVFFINDKPWAGWFHDCRYIFVNAENGGYSIASSTIFPKDQLTGYELISEASENDPADMSEGTGTLSDPLPPNDHYYAVIIAVGDYEGNEQFWFDVSLVYNTLIQIYGYKKQNIFVHYSYDGTSPIYGNDLDDPSDPSNDLDYSAFGTAIHATFNELAGITAQIEEIPALDTDDQLAIFVVDAPVIDNFPGLTLWAFWDENPGGYWLDVEDPLEIAQIVDQINCAQMTMAFSFNSAGGVVDEFNDYSGQAVCGSRYIHVCNYHGDKHDENYISGGQYSGEYLFYWAAAARGVYPGTNPWIPSEFEAGSFPFTTISGLESHPGDFDPDEDGDGYVQMEEAFYYANALDTWSDDGYYYNPWVPGEEEEPIDHDGVPFIEDVMTLAGYAGHVITPIMVQGNFVIGGILTFDPFGPGEEFIVDNYSKIYFINPQSKIVVAEDSKLEIYPDNTFYGTSLTNKIEVYGRFYTGINNDISFLGLDGSQWKGIEMHNTSLSGYLSLDYAHFQNCLISGDLLYLSVGNSDFTNSGIYVSKGSIAISSSTFLNSYIDVHNSINSIQTVSITSNNMEGQGIIKPAISVTSYCNLHISSNHINHYSGGINIYNCGKGAIESIIYDNILYYNTGSGIRIYNSFGEIHKNNSQQNDYGVQIYDRSNISFLGVENIEPGNLSQTQLIKDCESYEIYCSRSSFPYPFQWNAIIDENNTEPLVFTVGQEGPFDVRYNYWGVNFYPQLDFYPWPGYIWDPVWDPMSEDKDLNQAEEIYVEAKIAENDSNYILAKSKYMEIIIQYPSSICVEPAMKELFAIEQLLANDYSDLKYFYDNEPSIQNNPELTKLADFLANFCEIKLENWPTAIAWFEDVILNPESMEDSIFGIIDLGYTYFLMENGGLKSSYTGNLIEHKPVSVEQFEIKRDYLLSLLPGDQLSETMKHSINTLKSGELLQNVPNPFNGTTQIWYKLDEEAQVAIHVFDYTGKRVSTISPGKQDKGSHFVEFSSESLPAGIYFYTLELNSKVSDGKKMTVVK